MKIEIDYNGAFAVCNIELMEEPGKIVNFNDADTKSQTYALSAFRTIEEHWRRGGAGTAVRSDGLRQLREVQRVGTSAPIGASVM